MGDRQRPKQPETNPRVGDTRPQESRRPLLRRVDQVVVAGLVGCAIVGLGAYWFVNGGHRGELIEIDRAAPLTAKFQVDINKAAWPELAELPAMGETLARRIVESRQESGLFGDHNDLLRVNGIGPRRLELLKPYLLPMPGQEEVAGEVAPKEDTL